MKVPYHRSLYLVIFVAVWEVTALTLLTGIGLNYWLIKHEARTSREVARTLMLEASRALDAGGETGLRQWLKTLPEDRQGSPVLIFDDRDQELLGRRMPDNVTLALSAADAGAGEHYRAARRTHQVDESFQPVHWPIIPFPAPE